MTTGKSISVLKVSSSCEGEEAVLLFRFSNINMALMVLPEPRGGACLARIRAIHVPG